MTRELVKVLSGWNIPPLYQIFLDLHPLLESDVLKLKSNRSCRYFAGILFCFIFILSILHFIIVLFRLWSGTFLKLIYFWRNYLKFVKVSHYTHTTLGHRQNMFWNQRLLGHVFIRKERDKINDCPLRCSKIYVTVSCILDMCSNTI